MEPDLNDLLLAWNGAEMDANRKTALLSKLREDAVFRRAFVEELRMLGMLKATQSAEPRWLRLEDELGSKPAEPWDEEAFSTSIMSELSRTEPAGFLKANRWLIAAAVLVFAGVAAFWGLRLGGDRPAAVAGLDKTRDAGGFAIVSHLEGTATAEPRGRAVHEGDVVSAGRFRMPAGAATLRFFDGAVVFVEGEADLDLLALDRVLCYRGRLRVRMEEGASGFTVTSPGMAVVDLGTEFALNVTGDGAAALHVFDGKVEASVLNREGYTLRSELVQKDESASIQPGSGRIARTDQPADAFASAPTAPTPVLRLDRGYAVAVLASKPWGYWRFESLENGLTPNEIPGGLSLRAVGALRLSAEPGGNNTMEFSRDRGPEEGDRKEGQYLLMDGLWQQPAKPGYAVELWMMSAAIRESALVSLIDGSREGAPEEHYFLLQLMDQSQRWLHPNGSVRFLQRSPPGLGGGVNAFAQRAYLPGVWQHVVAQNSGDRMELYLNGRLVGHAPVDPDQAPGLYHLLVGRLKQSVRGGGDATRPFVGRMDELAFYEHTLSPADIASHYTLGNPPAPLQK